MLVDPIRAERVLGLAEGGQFSAKVTYIFRKQLEEADILVVTKSDLVDAARMERLKAALAKESPKAEVLAVSVRTGAGLDEWFAKMTGGEQVERATMEVDYGIYAEGEALLGWLNATVQVSASTPFDADTVLKGLAGEMQRVLTGEIAHLKMTLSPDTGLGDVAAINLVRSDFVPELSLRLEEPVESAQVILNCRAEASPEAIRDALESAVAAIRATGVSATVEHLEFFRPGKPEPTHRDQI